MKCGQKMKYNKKVQISIPYRSYKMVMSTFQAKHTSNLLNKNAKELVTKILIDTAK